MTWPPLAPCCPRSWRRSPIVKRRDEERHGVYRIKRLILEAHDAMAAAIATDQEYRSPFEAAPA